MKYRVWSMEGKTTDVESRSRHTRYAIHHTCSRGFTLLLAALVASITLALGVSIFEITQKQVILSSLGRDSQFAFYTADTGAECALYWDVRSDLHPDTFATSTASVTGETYAREVSCDKESPDVIIDSDTSNTVVSRFQFNLESVYKPEGLCAQVSVKKCVGTFDTDGTCTSDLLKLQTIIHADGYNTDCDSIETNPRALQRSVEIKY